WQYGHGPLLCPHRAETGAYMAVELGAAYISILPSKSKLAPEPYKSINKTVPKVGHQAAHTLGQRMSTAPSTWVRRGVVAAGVAAGAAAAAALAGGVKNAAAPENSQRVLTGPYESANAATAVVIDLRNVSTSSPLVYAAYLEAAKSLANAGVDGK